MSHKFMRFPGFRDKAVTLSYDDGVIFDKKLIEIMDKNGLKGTFNLNSGLFSNDGAWRLKKEDALKLYKDSGHEIAIHGRAHLSLADVPVAMANEDVMSDRLALEEMFGTVITGMAYANGSFDDKSVEVLKSCGVEYARTVRDTEGFGIPTDWLRLDPTCHHGNPRLMELAHRFIEDKPHWYYWLRYPKLFYVWGHSYEFHQCDNWNVIEEFAEYIGNRDDVWYATNIEIYRYVKAYEALVFSAAGESVYNPSAIDVYLDYFETEVLVKAGETISLKRQRCY